MAFVNDITGLGKDYDPHKWYFKMPDSALKHLEACFDGDKRKVYTMKRAINFPSSTLPKRCKMTLSVRGSLRIIALHSIP
jgi:hypothetical protein